MRRSSVAFTYENTTSRLASVTDALGQIKQYRYALDNRLAVIGYANASAIAFAAAPICAHDRGPQLVVMRCP
jgi:hypothetical protein